jgi:hypothetical protein
VPVEQKDNAGNTVAKSTINKIKESTITKKAVSFEGVANSWSNDNGVALPLGCPSVNDG